MKKFNTISCEELMTEPMQPLRFFVDGLITSGLYILAGYPKVGKSWLALDICLSIATGRDVLSAQTIRGRRCICAWRTARLVCRIVSTN